MVNTRILEQRLGWRAGDGDTPEPPSRPLGHQAILQGRVDAGGRGPARVGSAPRRRQRRVEADETWETLALVLDDIDRLELTGTAPSISHKSLAGAAMDQLRTQLLRVMAEKGWRRIGITSPARGAGRSFVAAGLAASIARLDTLRVLLIDADLEDPGLARLLGLDASGPLEALLRGETAPEDHLCRIGASLALALNAAPVRQAAERMMTPEALQALKAMIDSVAPEVVIHDLPPLINDPVSPTLLPQLDAVLLVADGMRSTAKDILECERLLEGQVPLLGVLLNKSEDRDPRTTRRRG
ncbi:MAG: CpsD/CapB family tyrosine-protein kinase [Pararhodobacter sp.]